MKKLDKKNLLKEKGLKKSLDLKNVKNIAPKLLALALFFNGEAGSLIGLNFSKQSGLLNAKTSSVKVNKRSSEKINEKVRSFESAEVLGKENVNFPKGYSLYSGLDSFSQFETKKDEIKGIWILESKNWKKLHLNDLDSVKIKPRKPYWIKVKEDFSLEMDRIFYTDKFNITMPGIAFIGGIEDESVIRNKFGYYYVYRDGAYQLKPDDIRWYETVVIKLGDKVSSENPSVLDYSNQKQYVEKLDQESAVQSPQAYTLPTGIIQGASYGSNADEVSVQQNVGQESVEEQNTPPFLKKSSEENLDLTSYESKIKSLNGYLETLKIVDKEGDSLSVQLKTRPSKGELKLETLDSFIDETNQRVELVALSYLPNYMDEGVDLFKISAVDDKGNSSEADYFLNIEKSSLEPKLKENQLVKNVISDKEINWKDLLLESNPLNLDLEIEVLEKGSLQGSVGFNGENIFYQPKTYTKGVDKVLLRVKNKEYNWFKDLNISFEVNTEDRTFKRMRRRNGDSTIQKWDYEKWEGNKVWYSDSVIIKNIEDAGAGPLQTIGTRTIGETYWRLSPQIQNVIGDGFNYHNPSVQRGKRTTNVYGTEVRYKYQKVSTRTSDSSIYERTDTVNPKDFNYNGEIKRQNPETQERITYTTGFDKIEYGAARVRKKLERLPFFFDKLPPEKKQEMLDKWSAGQNEYEVYPCGTISEFANQCPNQMEASQNINPGLILGLEGTESTSGFTSIQSEIVNLYNGSIPQSQLVDLSSGEGATVYGLGFSQDIGLLDNLEKDKALIKELKDSINQKLWLGDGYSESLSDSQEAEIENLARLILEYKLSHDLAFKNSFDESVKMMEEQGIDHTAVVQGIKDGTIKATKEILISYKELLSDPVDSILSTTEGILSGAMNFIKDPAGIAAQGGQVINEVITLVKKVPGSLLKYSGYERSMILSYTSTHVGYQVINPVGKVKYINKVELPVWVNRSKVIVYFNDQTRFIKFETLTSIADKAGKHVVQIINKPDYERSYFEKLLIVKLGSKDKMNVEEHHFLSDKHSEFTDQFLDITKKFGISTEKDLKNGKWNKEFLADHRGRHDAGYHLFMLDKINKIAKNSNTKEEFLKGFESLKKYVAENPSILYKD